MTSFNAIQLAFYCLEKKRERKRHIKNVTICPRKAWRHGVMASAAFIVFLVKIQQQTTRNGHTTMQVEPRGLGYDNRFAPRQRNRVVVMALPNLMGGNAMQYTVIRSTVLII